MAGKFDPEKDYNKDGKVDRKDKKFFQEQDFNGDGEVTKEEKQAWKATQPDRVSREELAENYDFALSVIFANKELRDLFLEAFNDRSGQWTADRFQAALKNTDWWKKGKYWRDAFYIEKEGIEWEEQTKTARRVISARANELGVTLSEGDLKRLARQYLYEGWFDGPRSAFLDDALTEFMGEAPGVGDQDYAAELRAMAFQYGIEKMLDESWYANAVRSLTRRETTMERLMAEIREKAKSKYPALSKMIDNGESVRSSMKGYLGSMASILELDEGLIDLDDPTLRQVLTAQNGEDGLPALMTLYDFEASLRKDPRWQRTKNGRQTIVNTAQSFLQSLGFVG